MEQQNKSSLDEILVTTKILSLTASRKKGENPQMFESDSSTIDSNDLGLEKMNFRSIYLRLAY